MRGFLAAKLAHGHGHRPGFAAHALGYEAYGAAMTPPVEPTPAAAAPSRLLRPTPPMERVEIPPGVLEFLANGGRL